MKFELDTLAGIHDRMALVKAQSTGRFLTNYFRQELVGPQILTAATHQRGIRAGVPWINQTDTRLLRCMSRWARA
jgi:hypothetical protein